MNRETTEPRSFPYPYLAMMAICSDLDETPDSNIYRETARFLNGGGMTSMGEGLGLEVGNTIYFDMPRGQFSYWNADDGGREMIRTLIRSGHVDCLHSYGDLATERAHAGRALDELDRHGLRLRVWIDHAVAPTNFDGDIMKGEGDVPGARAYHADLTLGFGIRYVWRGRVTSVSGQDVPRRLSGILRPDHPVASSRTLAKEFAKGCVGGLRGGKYAMHAGNGLLRRVTLRDGGPAVEFIRSNPHWGGVSRGETPEGIAEVLTPAFLDRIEERGGTCILYTHLGKVRGRTVPFESGTVRAFRLLRDRALAGRILVTTTRRLLDYARIRGTHRVRLAGTGDGWRLDIESGEDGTGNKEDAIPDGLTFYVPDPARTRVFFDGKEVPGIHRNPPDRTGRRSVSIPWASLRFPEA